MAGRNWTKRFSWPCDDEASREYTFRIPDDHQKDRPRHGHRLCSLG